MKKSTKNNKKGNRVAKNVDEYLAGLPKDMQGALEKLRRAIKAAAPKAEELISYRIPAYKQQGFLIFFVAHPNHCSLVTASQAVVDSLKKVLKGFETSGTTIHFTADKPLPAALVKKIVKMRIEENEAHAADKKK